MNTMMISGVPERLSALRLQKGLTQEAVANAIGVSNRTISKWETGVSLPDVEYIPLLADFFDITIDDLFGRVSVKGSFYDDIGKAFEGRHPSQNISMTFSLLHDLLRSSYSRLKGIPSLADVIPDRVVSGDMYRIVGSSNAGFEMLVNSPHTNMALALFQNEDDFSWLDNHSNDLIPLFKLLSHPLGMKLIKTIYSQGFTPRFALDYIARRMGAEIAEVKPLLDLAVLAKVCGKLEADLRDGMTEIYECHCNGMVLAILDLAYELICGEDRNEFFYGGTARLIRGKMHENR